MARAVPRRSIDELALRYKLNPGLGRDIYVEGLRDKGLIEWYLRKRDVSDASVYTIDTVDVPESALLARGLDGGSSRSRVVALRSELAGRGVDVDSQLFIVDRDQEDLCPTPCIDGVLLTDYGALMTHLAQPDAFLRLVQLVGRDRVSHEDFMGFLDVACSEVYLIRSAAKRLRLPVKFLDADDFVRVDKVRGLVFDAAGYLARCAIASGLARSLDALRAEIEVCRGEVGRLAFGSFAAANDHDLFGFAKKALRLAGDGVNRTSDSICDLFLMSADVSVLKEHNLFKALA